MESLEKRVKNLETSLNPGGDKFTFIVKIIDVVDDSCKCLIIGDDKPYSFYDKQSFLDWAAKIGLSQAEIDEISPETWKIDKACR